MIQQFTNSIIGIAVLIVLISSMIGCGGDDDALFIGDNYLPIEVGNFWSFIPPEYPDDPATIAITGTTKLSSGKTVLIAKVTYDREEAK